MAGGTPQRLSVYQAGDFKVVDGANLGDDLGCGEDLQFDDVYHLDAAGPAAGALGLPDRPAPPAPRRDAAAGR